MSSAFRSTGRTGFRSGYSVNQNQGGGSKKAGLVPSVGNDSWSSLFRGIVSPDGKCCTARSLATTLVFTKNVYRPTDGRVGNYRGFP